jgi:polyhydroxybutyrate depolymerase
LFKRVLKILALLLILGLIGLGATAWWFLGYDSMPAPELAGSLDLGSVEHDGLERTWLAYLPSKPRPSMPLVIALHGSRGDGQQMMLGSRYGFNILAEREGFVAVYPDGFEGHWNDCRAGADYSANTRDIDDVGFLQALIARMVQEQGVDPSRVYVTGMSNGGHMAFRLVLESPDLLAAIAPVAANLPIPENLDCAPVEQGVSVLMINGTADPINPHEGGVVNIFGNTSRGSVLSSMETVQYWARLAGYEGPGKQQAWVDRVPDDGPSINSTHWSAPGKADVALVTVLGGGHTMPHKTHRLPRIIGPTSREFDTAEMIWSFFKGGNSELPTR